MGHASILPAVAMLIAMAACLLTTRSAGAQGFAGDWTPLSLTDGGKWSFIGGDWRQTEKGVIMPPGVRTDDNLSFRSDRS